MKISICKKTCNKCGFSRKGTKNTLYKEILHYISQGKVFPCHLELKKVTGSENSGVSKLKEVKICRGYVGFIKKNLDNTTFNPILVEYLSDFMDQINDEELEDIYSKEELYEAHQDTIHVSLRETTNWKERD